MIVIKWKFTDFKKKSRQLQNKDTENWEVWMLTMKMETLTFKLAV